MSQTIGAAINAAYGTAPVVLTAPAGATGIVLKADKGGWRIRLGSFAGAMPATEFPVGTISNGAGGAYLAPTQSVTLSKNWDAITVAGYAADSVLSYYWI